MKLYALAMSAQAIASWFFLRGLAFIYLIAFASLLPQALGLWGEHGVLPIANLLPAARQVYGNSAYIHLPSLFWFRSTDFVLLALAWLGILVSLLALFGFAQG